MSAPRALLLVAHGSRRAAANAEVARLAGRLAAAAPDAWPLVRHAFLELAEPDIPAGLDACVAAGAGAVVVVPYFLAAGRHVREDIPALVAAARRRHPAVDIRLRPHLGADAALAAAVLERAAPPGGAGADAESGGRV